MRTSAKSPENIIDTVGEPTLTQGKLKEGRITQIDVIRGDIYASRIRATQ